MAGVLEFLRINLQSDVDVVCVTFTSFPLKVKFAWPSKVLAVSEPVITLLTPLLFIVVAVPVIPVNAEPSPANFVAVTVPVLGLYVKSPSDSRPTLPVAEASSIKGIRLFSLVDSLSATET